MSDLLRKGAEWLGQKRREHCSSPVDYIQDGTTVPVQATYGKTGYTISDGQGGSVGAHVVDFLIMADELNLKPKEGDTIIADGVTYEVMNFGDDGCWRWSGSYLITFRIHTREVG